jgi:hypothetical protein
MAKSIVRSDLGCRDSATMFPSACKGFAICTPTVVPLIIVLGVIGTLIALSDAAYVKQKAKDYLTKK